MGAVATPHDGLSRSPRRHFAKFAAVYIAEYKLPREIVVRDIPRNPSGKVVKHLSTMNSASVDHQTSTLKGMR
jgi:acyl-coenzyme A synthetase/AMP-(fatty) acid ligase